MTDYYRQNLNNQPVDASGNAPVKEVVRRLTWIGVLVVIMLAYAWIQAETLRVNYGISKTKDQNIELRESVAAYKVEHSRLTAPGRIAAQADRLGFIRCDQGVRMVEADWPTFDPDRPLMASR